MEIMVNVVHASVTAEWVAIAVLMALWDLLSFSYFKKMVSVICFQSKWWERRPFGHEPVSFRIISSYVFFKQKSMNQNIFVIEGLIMKRCRNNKFEKRR